jgi:hypothetical protein
VERLNLTLDDVTFRELERHAKRTGEKRAAVARALILEGLERRSRQEQKRRLAEDYAAGRSDAREVLQDLELAQMDLVDDEE